jgi:CBS domain containing-hemolysin-like protein
MTSEDWAALVAVSLLLFWSGFFSAAEVGFLGIGRYKLRQLVAKGSRSARLVQNLLESPGALLTGILVTITTLNYTAETIASRWAITHLGHLWGPALAVVGLSAVVLLFAEVTPISYASANPDRTAVLAARPVWLVVALLRWPTALLTATAQLIVRLVAGRAPGQEPLVTEEDVRAVVEMEAERGTLEEEEKEIIQSIFEFGDTVAGEVLVPKQDIIAVEKSAPLSSALALASQRHFSRLPVYDADPDRIVGIVNVKDLLPLLLSQGPQRTVQEVMRPALKVPHTRRISELMRELRRRKEWMALVVGEDGSLRGLTTMEDLLEEIVGEMYDESDAVVRPAVKVAPGVWLFDGRLSLEEASRLIEGELPGGDYATLAGLVYDRLGHSPQRGAQITIDGIRVAVDAVEGRRVTRVRVETSDASGEGAAS